MAKKDDTTKGFNTKVEVAPLCEPCLRYTIYIGATTDSTQLYACPRCGSVRISENKRKELWDEA